MMYKKLISNTKFFFEFFLIVSIAAFDQITKTTLIFLLKNKPYYTINVLPFLDIVYVWNYGLSFGLFRNYYQFSNIIFLFINSGVVIYLFILLSKNKDKIVSCSLSILIGGAIGNLIDRCIRGAVFDFIYLHYQELNFPVFNVADSFITIGATILALRYIYIDKNK